MHPWNPVHIGEFLWDFVCSIINSCERYKSYKNKVVTKIIGKMQEIAPFETEQIGRQFSLLKQTNSHEKIPLCNEVVAP